MAYLGNKANSKNSKYDVASDPDPVGDALGDEPGGPCLQLLGCLDQIAAHKACKQALLCFRLQKLPGEGNAYKDMEASKQCFSSGYTSFMSGHKACLRVV